MSVNAPQAGVITELLANEEDTVTVGQDLFVVEAGEGGQAPPASAYTLYLHARSKHMADLVFHWSRSAPKEDKKPEPTEEAKQEQKQEEQKQPAKEEKPKEDKPKDEKKSAPPAESKSEKKPAAKESKPTPTPGSRTETRVRSAPLIVSPCVSLLIPSRRSR